MPEGSAGIAADDSNSEGSSGNRGGNIVNDGIAAIMGDWIYYRKNRPPGPAVPGFTF